MEENKEEGMTPQYKFFLFLKENGIIWEGPLPKTEEELQNKIASIKDVRERFQGTLGRMRNMG